MGNLIWDSDHKASLFLGRDQRISSYEHCEWGHGASTSSHLAALAVGRRSGWGRQGGLCTHSKNQPCQQVSLTSPDSGDSGAWRPRLLWPGAGRVMHTPPRRAAESSLEAEVLQFLLFLCKVVVLSFCCPWTCLGNGIWESEGWTIPNQIPLILCQQIWTFKATWPIRTFSRSHVQGWSRQHCSHRPQL